MSKERDFQEVMAENMQARVVTGEEEGQAVIDEFKAKGWRIAAISNTGLEPGQARITFMPEKHFTEVTGIVGEISENEVL